MMLCEISYIVIMTIWREKRMQRTHTEAFIDEVVECVTITCVCKLIVIGRQLLKTLDCNSTEVSRKCCVLRQHCCAPRYKAVDERLSPHVDPASSMSLNHSKLITSRVLNHFPNPSLPATQQSNASAILLYPISRATNFTSRNGETGQ